jgi:hypothetical protein
MGIRARKPEDTMLTLPGGDWLVVKKHLTYGDQQQIYRRLWTPLDDGRSVVDHAMRYGEIAIVIQYLLDWSIADGAGTPIKIQTPTGEPDTAKIRSALELLDVEDVKTIETAVIAHHSAMEKLREAEKNVRADATASATRSESPA